MQIKKVSFLGVKRSRSPQATRSHTGEFAEANCGENLNLHIRNNFWIYMSYIFCYKVKHKVFSLYDTQRTFAFLRLNTFFNPEYMST